MNCLRSLCLASIVVALAACAEPFRDDSRYVSVGPKNGYYILQKGGPLAVRLGYQFPPTSDAGDALHRGYGVDVIAFRFDRAGVLTAPPAYFSQLPADTAITGRLGLLRQGVSTWPQIRGIFGLPNWRIKQADGGLLVYHEISIYDPLEQDYTSAARSETSLVN